MSFASDADYRFVIDKEDAVLKTSRFASLYDNINEEIKESGAGQEDETSDDDEMEDTSNIQATTTTITTAKTAMYGALPFKPRLDEYLIDSCEEKLSDTLFYVRHARRLASSQNV